MNNQLLLFTFLGIWVGVLVTMEIPYKNRHRGYIWRFLRRYIPPFRWWNRQEQWTERFFTYAVALLAIQLVLPARPGMLVYWGGLIIQHFDDYYNGDDDERKKRWERVKNKIRWVVPKPAPQKAGA